MIKILKHLKKEKGVDLIVTELDAKTAEIITKSEKDIIDYLLEKHLIELSEHVDNDIIIKHFKDFLIGSVFTHYIDMVGILNYIYIMRNIIKIAKKHPSHSKFLFTTKFKNYVGDEPEDELEDESEDDDAFFGVSFKTELLDKKNLDFVEEAVFRSFNDMYDGKILTVKPKKVKMYLKNLETPNGIKEYLYMDISFCKSNK